MRTHLITLTLAAITALGLGSVAFAQDDVEEKFYNFNDMLIDGDYKTPQGDINISHRKAEFERNSKLKKSFLHKIQDSTQEDALVEAD